MAILSASVLQEITNIGTTATPYVTRATSNIYIQQIIIHNPSASSASVSIYKVPNNVGAIGTVSNSNLWYVEDILPNATIFISLDKPGIILGNTNDTLQLASSITTLTLQIYGFTEV